MRIRRTLLIILLVGTGTSILLLLFAGWVKYLDLRIRVALAEEQTRYFEDAVQSAGTQASAEVIQGLIAGITNYYPSGTKQVDGSHLDIMVERARSNAIERLERQRAVREGTSK